ncbi:PfkB family carbohydrate kinase [Kribbella sp. C-35]|uniref:PfkB family carbohydrate kinase n=1 Tax=Kribbella sp. C-35 TaxID=2789276 RepID=UPI00397CCA9F
MRDTISPDGQENVLLHVLQELRSLDRPAFSQLQSGHDELTALLGLATVRRYATVHDVALEASALAVVSQCVRALDGSERIVADAVLGLGTFAEEYAWHQIDRRTIRTLSDAPLDRRRGVLLTNWAALLKALGHESDARPPSAADLDERLEAAALRAVARQLVRREMYSVGSTNSGARPAPGVIEPESQRAQGRIIVIGAAVMDATFRMREFPRWETSSESQEFSISPGGKGLTQAVAAARLGHRVSLVAAVADDRYGTEIVSHLRYNNVDTSLLKVVPGTRTPFTGVFQMDLGDSVATYWRNDKEVRLDPWDCDELSSELAASDAVLMTFEVPRETVEHALTLLPGGGDDHPVAIVTVAQPYQHATLTSRALERIDYVVAHPWELQRLVSGTQEVFDPDPATRELLARGVGSVCLLLRGGCTIYSHSAQDVIQAPVLASIYKESAAARDAYCAALADELIQSDGQFSRQTAIWASAAMSCAIADYPLMNPLPTPGRIEALLSRFPFLP